MVGVGVALIVAGGAISFVGAAIGGLVSLIMGVVAVFKILAAVVPVILSPIGLVTAAVVALAGYLITTSDAGSQALSWLGEQFQGLRAGRGALHGCLRFAARPGGQEIIFRLAASPNATSLTVGDIIGIDMKGWEYLWVRYQDAEDEDVLVKQPAAVYVEQFYPYGDFALLGIGT